MSEVDCFSQPWPIPSFGRWGRAPSPLSPVDPPIVRYMFLWEVTVQIFTYKIVSVLQSVTRTETVGLDSKSTVSELESVTRKPCYRKDDRAMRLICGCPEKFREASQTPRATFPEICKGFLFRLILRMCVQNLKFVALSVPEIIGGTQKIWAVPVCAHAPASPKFLIGFCWYGPSEYICQIWSS